MSIDEDLEALATFLDKNKLPWPTMVGDGSKTAAQKYGVRAIPTMMAIDRDGKILGVAHRIQDLAPIIEKQLAAKAN